MPETMFGTENLVVTRSEKNEGERKEIPAVPPSAGSFTLAMAPLYICFLDLHLFVYA